MLHDHQMQESNSMSFSLQLLMDATVTRNHEIVKITQNCETGTQYGEIYQIEVSEIDVIEQNKISAVPLMNLLHIQIHLTTLILSSMDQIA